MENGYEKVFAISDIGEIQPEGYLAKFTVFALGERDANIMLSSTSQPDLKRDFVYEIGMNE